MTTSTFDIAPVTEPAAVDPATDAALIPEPTSSALDRIKAKYAVARREAAEKLEFALPVPRMELVVVKYRAVTNAEWNGLLEMAGKTKMNPLETQQRTLATFCTGIYFKGDDGELVSIDLENPTQPAPRFDQRAANALDLPWGGLAYALVDELYLTDGDVISTSAALLDLSGYQRGMEIAASAEGN